MKNLLQIILKMMSLILNTEESDYKNLINRLKEIKANYCFIGKNNI